MWSPQGIGYSATLPEGLAELPKELVSHSGDHKDLKPFQAKDVVVVGAGQSGLETAALLHEQGTRVRILARKDHIKWNPENKGARSLYQKIRYPDSGLGFGWRYAAISELPQTFFALPKVVAALGRGEKPRPIWRLVAQGESIRKNTPPHVAWRSCMPPSSAANYGLSIQAGTKIIEITADHLVARDRFQTGSGAHRLLDPRLASNIRALGGVPFLNREFESSVPGLFFVGLISAPTFGPVMRFMFGAKHVAPVLARRFEAQARFRLPVPIRAAASG